jgi:hypothetical protein
VGHGIVQGSDLSKLLDPTFDSAVDETGAYQRVAAVHHSMGYRIDTLGFAGKEFFQEIFWRMISMGISLDPQGCNAFCVGLEEPETHRGAACVDSKEAHAAIPCFDYASLVRAEHTASLHGALL